MKIAFRRTLALALVAAACSSARPPEETSRPEVDAGTLQPSAAGSFPSSPTSSIGIISPDRHLGAVCDPSRTVAADSPSLIVRDPAVLARFSLERALQRLIESGEARITPLELLQRLFDTQNDSAHAVFVNNPHCDQLRAGSIAEVDPYDCPRAEGALARSAGLLDPAHPDYFAPVAVINRFDLTPKSLATCGEYRIMYAKQSGRTNPNERVFLMLEGALRNPLRAIADCRSVAELWARVGTVSADEASDLLESFFFEGVGGFKPVLHADHFGTLDSQCGYSGECGQVRVGQGMQSPWQFRQFRLRKTGQFLPAPGAAPWAPFFFGPSVATSSPRPDLFDPMVQRSEQFRDAFVHHHVKTLSEPEVARMLFLSDPEHEAIESSVEGPSQPNFARATELPSWPALAAQLAERLATPELTQVTAACPAADPVTPTVLLQRATAATCAGCHAPDRLLMPDRALGCGQTQPKSLGTVHIDELGALSEALTTVFLPHRAAVLTTFLRACSYEAIERNLLPQSTTQVIVECFVAGTPIAMADGSEKSIERVVPGDSVLAFDEASQTLVQAPVVRSVVRPDADRLIVINDTLIATPNHRFYTPHGLVRADELQLGDALLEIRAGASALSVAPTSVRRLALQEGSVASYNIEVAEYGNYFAGGVLVHDRP